VEYKADANCVKQCMMRLVELDRGMLEVEKDTVRIAVIGN